MISPDHDLPAETPLLDKRFSWERSPTTPIGSTPAVETPSTPRSAFRQSLQKPLSPPNRLVHQTPPRHRYAGQYRPYEPTGHPTLTQDEEGQLEMEETPKKTKRWSDQLRGFQSSLAGLGTDDDWGSSLTSALYGDVGMGVGLQTVHESESGGRESIDSESSSRVTNESEELKPKTSSPGPVPDSSPSSATSVETDMKALAISPTSSNDSRPGVSPPGSPSTPRGAKIRRKPVPSVGSPTNRRHSARSTRSAGTPQAERQWPTSPSGAPSSDLHHIRSRSIGQSRSNDSELDHELRTPSTNEHFPLSLSKPESSDSLLPPLPRSISEESQWTLALARTQSRGTKEVVAEVIHPWHQFGFRNDDSPPRPDPRLSLPATAGYTESSPPSRCHTPLHSDTEHLPPPHDLPALTPDHLPAPVPAPVPAVPSPSKRPISSPRSPTSSPRSSNTSPRYRHRDKDPMSRLDNAKRSERASIALSMISSASDARSSLGSLKSSYLHEAKVLKAYMRDPAEHDLGGLRESDAERESSASTSEREMNGSESGSEGHVHGLAQAAVIKPGKGTPDSSRIRLSGDRTHVKSNSQTTSTSRKSASKRSHTSSIDSTRSRRSREKEVPTSPHPFAYQPEQYEDKEDDAMLALDDAAREVARQRGRFVSSRAGRGRGGGSGRERFDDAEV
jgi:hypothetical protein